MRRTMGLILRSWPLMPSPSPGGVDDGVTPSTLATADGGICRGLKASEPWTEPGHVQDRSLDCDLRREKRLRGASARFSTGYG